MLISRGMVMYRVAVLFFIVVVAIAAIERNTPKSRRNKALNLLDQITTDFVPSSSPEATTTSSGALRTKVFESPFSTTSFTQTFNTVLYAPDNVTISQAAGFGLNFCIPRFQFDGTTNSAYTIVTASDDTSITLTTYQFVGSTNCAGVEPVVQTKTFSIFTGYIIDYEECNSMNGATVTFPAKVHNYIATTTTPYNDFPSGSLYKDFYNTPFCNTDAYLGYDWTALSKCGNAATQNGYCYYETMTALEYYKVQTLLHQDGCSVLQSTSVTTAEVTCYTYPDSLESYTIYYTKPSGDDDDNISLTESEYGGLIASVFIALLVGIVSTALVMIYCLGMKYPVGSLKQKLIDKEQL